MKNGDTHKSWTVIIISEKNQIGSFEVTKAFIITLLVILLGFIITITTAYWLNNRSQIFIQKELAGKLTETENLLNIANQKNADLEDTLSSLFHKTPSSKDKSNIITTDKLNKIAIENFQTHFDDKKDTLHYKFLLRNKKTDNVHISGYIFVILKTDYLNSSSWHSYPNAILNYGAPQDFKKGESFSVARFRTIRGKFNEISRQVSSSFISIWIFSRNGKLLLTKDFYVKNLRR